VRVSSPPQPSPSKKLSKVRILQQDPPPLTPLHIFHINPPSAGPRSQAWETWRTRDQLRLDPQLSPYRVVSEPFGMRQLFLEVSPGGALATTGGRTVDDGACLSCLVLSCPALAKELSVYLYLPVLPRSLAFRELGPGSLGYGLGWFGLVWVGLVWFWGLGRLPPDTLILYCPFPVTSRVMTDHGMGWGFSRKTRRPFFLLPSPSLT
jgi:hypothetical protein